MQEKIKQAYEKINISKEAKDRIQMAVMMQNAEEKKKRQMHHGWKIAMAACLLAICIVPSGVYAAQKIYQFFSVSVKKDNRNVSMHITKETNPSQQYIMVTADFGAEYEVSKKETTNDTLISCEYKKGFESGKSFWYQVEYMDGDQKEILNTYDVKKNEILQINGKKAVYCKYNDIVGSRYHKDHKTDYGQTIYLFAEKEGYIIEIAAQNGLEKDEFIKLAKKIKIQKTTSKKEASKYILYSERMQNGWNIPNTAMDQKDIDLKESANYYTGNKAVVNRNDYTGSKAVIRKNKITVTDVKVFDSTRSLQKNAFIKDNFAYKKIVEKNGTLKKYNREKVKYGDGIKTPERKVEATESIQPKLVYVTMMIEGKSPLSNGRYSVPSMQLVTKKDGKIIKADDSYNRPEYIKDAYTDQMPCYFEESLGGKSAWFAPMNGNHVTLHFAYLVDEDQIHGMALVLNDWVSSSRKLVYLDISK